MDPNAALEIIRRLCVDVLGDEDNPGAGEELALVVVALDEWLCRGGFKPEAWS